MQIRETETQIKLKSFIFNYEFLCHFNSNVQNTNCIQNALKAICTKICIKVNDKVWSREIDRKRERERERVCENCANGIGGKQRNYMLSIIMAMTNSKGNTLCTKVKMKSCKWTFPLVIFTPLLLLFPQGGCICNGCNSDKLHVALKMRACVYKNGKSQLNNAKSST